MGMGCAQSESTTGPNQNTGQNDKKGEYESAFTEVDKIAELHEAVA